MSQTNAFQCRRNRRSMVRLVPVAAGAALLLAGCSADIARFDQPARFNLTEGKASGAPVPAAGMASGPRGPGAGFTDPPPAEQRSGNSIYTPGRAERSGSITMAALPEPTGAGSASTASSPATPSRIDLRTGRPVSVAQAPASPSSPPAKGAAITVAAGDTLYGLSKKHHVSISELMAVNDLKSPQIKPGQNLFLPAGPRAGSAGALPVRPQKAPTKSLASAEPAATASAAAGDAAGRHTIQAGDSLFKIARQHSVTVDQLKAANPGLDPRHLKPGAVVRLPGSEAAAAPVAMRPAAPTRVASVRLEAPAATAAPASSAPPPAAVPPSPSASVVPPIGGGIEPTIVNGSTVAKVAGANTQDSASAVAGVGVKPVKLAEVKPETPAAGDLPPMAGKLRWPVKGKVIATFGARSEGGHNDGINLAVPLGADVHAAESGVVAYAGSELKGYGNLVLIRHDNGWVTAYAHNDQVLVKRGDKVKRGQVVGKAGKTGTVDQPQVHFELRMGSKPVDPMPYMEKS